MNGRIKRIFFQQNNFTITIVGIVETTDYDVV